MTPEQHLLDLKQSIQDNHYGVLVSAPDWYAAPARVAIDTMLETIEEAIANHKAAK